MEKILFCILLSAAALMTNGCVAVQMAPSEAMEPDVYRISARATSRKILAETVKSAKERCAQENKQYLFVKNIFQHSSSLGIDMGSYDLYFTCVEAGDPRLNERKSLLRPADEKADQVGQTITPPKDQGQRIPEKVVPEKVVPEKVVPEKVVPEKVVPEKVVPEKVVPEKVKLVPPKDENQEQQEAATKASQELLRKKNPETGEPESLRKDVSPLDDEAGQDSPIIEESLGGYILDKENYLKRRFRKKK